ncbi:MAG: histidine kinase [Lewinella sp.]
MKLNLSKITGIGLSCLLFICLVSCKNEGGMVVANGGDNSTEVERIVVGMDDPILSGLKNPDSLLSVLRPLLLSEPALWELETWFDDKGIWEPAFLSSDTILYCGQYIFNDLKKAGKLSEAARVLSGIGRINYAIGRYPISLAHQQQALNLAQEAGDSLAMGWALGGLCRIFFNASDVERGKEYLFKAIEIGKRLKDPGINCVGKMALSGYYSLLEQQDTAMIIMKEALLMARENEFYKIEALGKLNYTYFLIESKQYDQAIAELTGEQSIKTEAISMASCVLNFNLYEAYIGKKDYFNALLSLEKGCGQAERLDFGFGKSFCEKSWTEFYELEGDYQAAFKAFRKYHEVDKNQFGIEKQQELEKLKTQQALNEKDWEIERLQQEEVKRRRTYLNRLYWGVGILLGIGGSFAFVYFRNQIKMADQKKIIAETKLQVLQSQMNPHFIYNAMTGIQNYVLRSEKMEAYSYLGKFAALLRIITRTSTETHIELDREIDLIKTYLHLEKMRFREAFVYKLEVDDSLLNINSEIPSMMIQPVVENAIIHGISGLERQGELTVSLNPYRDGIKCQVRDNGRGRVAANEISKREGNIHLSIASINNEERLEFLRSMGYESARIEVLDHYDNGEAVGTSVCIYLPFRAENNRIL